MYLTVGWPRYLNCAKQERAPDIILQVIANKFRTLHAVISERSISVWYCKPCVKIVCYNRPAEQIEDTGIYQQACWRNDSSMLGITTNKGYVLLYQLEQDVKDDRALVLYEYNLPGSRMSNSSNAGVNTDFNDQIPALRLALKTIVKYQTPITSICCLRDDILLTTSERRLDLLSWDHPTDVDDGNFVNCVRTISLSDIAFAMDLQQGRAPQNPYNARNFGSGFASHHNPYNKSYAYDTSPVHSAYVTKSMYCHDCDGFLIILSDGRAALVKESPRYHSHHQNSPASPASSTSSKDEIRGMNKKNSNDIPDEGKNFNYTGGKGQGYQEVTYHGCWAPALRDAVSVGVNNWLLGGFHFLPSFYPFILTSALRFLKNFAKL